MITITIIEIIHRIKYSFLFFDFLFKFLQKREIFFIENFFYFLIANWISFVHLENYVIYIQSSKIERS